MFWVRICQENPRGKISCLPQPYSSGRAQVIDTQDHQWSLNTCDNVTEHYYMENNAWYERTASLPPEYTHSPMLSWLNIGNKDGRIQDGRIQDKIIQEINLKKKKEYQNLLAIRVSYPHCKI